MRIAVIIPALDAAATIGPAIRSALGQTRPPDAVIVVDNGSTDDTVAIAAAFGPPVRVIAEARRGAATARRTGAAATDADAFLFLDADDLIAPDTLEALAGGLARAAVALCPWMRLSEADGVPVVEPASCPPRRRGEDPLAAWLRGWYHPPCAVLWSRAAYERAGGWDPEIGVNDDGDLMMRGLVRGNRIALVRGGTGYYRRVAGSLSGTAATDAGIASRLAVLDRIAAMLGARGRLTRYRPALLGAYDTVLTRATGDLAARGRAARAAVARGEAPPARPEPAPPTATLLQETPPLAAPAVERRGGPRVSVIIPTYNRRTTLPRAIGSVLSQDMADLELLVVDDGSTDGTDALVEGWGDPRIRLLRQPRNAGVAAARNRGIREARGDTLAFLDSDDEWCPGKLAAQLECLARGPASLGLVYGDAENADIHGTATIRAEAEGFIFGPMLGVNLLHGAPSSALVPRHVIDTVGFFDETLPAVEDWDFWIRVARFFTVAAVRQTVVRIHDAAPAPGLERRSRNFTANMVAREMLFRRYEAEMRRAGVAHLFLHDVARRHLEHPDGEATAARRLALRALKRAPLAPRAWAWLPYAVLPSGPRREIRDVSRRLRARLAGP